MGTGRAAQLYKWQHQCALSSFFLHPVHSTPETIAKKKGQRLACLLAGEECNFLENTASKDDNLPFQSKELDG